MNKQSQLAGGAGRDAVRPYKQTQFGVPSREEGCRRGQTKPNLGGLGHLGDGVEGFVQTNPIMQNEANSEGCRAGTPNPFAVAQGRLYEEPIVPNKPNSDRGHVRGKSCTGKELWWIIHAEDFGKTKPIEKKFEVRGVKFEVRNEANLAGRPGPWRAECAKQTQFPGTGRSGGRLYKQSQFLDCGFRIMSLRAERGNLDCGLCKTNPTCSPAVPGGTGPQGRGMRGNRAKRTQFRPLGPWRAPIIPLFHHSTIPIPCRSCETKPIARSGAPRRCPGIGPKRWMWNPPPYAGHTRGTLQAGFCARGIACERSMTCRGRERPRIAGRMPATRSQPKLTCNRPAFCAWGLARFAGIWYRGVAVVASST